MVLLLGNDSISGFRNVEYCKSKHVHERTRIFGTIGFPDFKISSGKYSISGLGNVEHRNLGNLVWC